MTSACAFREAENYYLSRNKRGEAVRASPLLLVLLKVVVELENGAKGGNRR
jgi:hypothetical protein